MALQANNAKNAQLVQNDGTVFCVFESREGPATQQNATIYLTVSSLSVLAEIRIKRNGHKKEKKIAHPAKWWMKTPDQTREKDETAARKRQESELGELPLPPL